MASTLFRNSARRWPILFRTSLASIVGIGLALVVVGDVYASLGRTAHTTVAVVNPTPDFAFYGSGFDDDEVRNSTSVFAQGCVSRTCGVYELGPQAGSDRFVGKIIRDIDDYEYPDLIGASEEHVYFFGGRSYYSLHSLNIDTGEVERLFRLTDRFVNLGSEAIACDTTSCYRTDGTWDGTFDLSYESGDVTFSDGRLFVYNNSNRVVVTDGSEKANNELFRCPTSECEVQGGQVGDRYYFTVSNRRNAKSYGLWSTDGTLEGLREEALPAGQVLRDVEVIEDGSGTAVVFSSWTGDIVVDSDGVGRLADRAGVSNEYRTFDADDGSIWLGSDGGLIEYVPATGAVARYPALRDWYAASVLSRKGLVIRDGVDPTEFQRGLHSRLYRFDIGNDEVDEPCRLTQLKVPRTVSRHSPLIVSARLRTRFHSEFNGSCRTLEISLAGRVIGRKVGDAGGEYISVKVNSSDLKIRPGKRRVKIAAPTTSMHQPVAPEVRVIRFG